MSVLNWREICYGSANSALLTLMNITTEMIARTVSSHDEHIIIPHLNEVREMLLNHPWGERMLFLLGRQDLAKTKVHRIVDGEVNFRPPNCVGTALYVAGVGELPTPYHGYSFDLDPHVGIEYLGPLKHPLLVLSVNFESSGWHAGVFLGSIGYEAIAFAQQGAGKPFGVETVRRNYVVPRFYTPAPNIRLVAPPSHVE